MSDNSIEKEFYIRQHRLEHQAGIDHNFDTDLKVIYDSWFSDKKRYHVIEETLDKSKQYNLLLEVGSAGGATLKYFSENYKFKKIIGYDIAFSETTLFKQKKYKNIELIEGNFNYDISQENNSVDCLVLMMIIEHLFDPFHSFSEIHRLLSKEGLAFINLPLVTSIKNRYRLLLGKLPETSVEYNRWFADKEWDGNHLHYFSINSIKKICKKYNLEIVKIRPVGEMIFLKKLFPSLFANEISFCVKKK